MSLYFIAVVLPEELCEKVKAVSKDFAERFGSVKAFNNFPHITLIAPFRLEENLEDNLAQVFAELHLGNTSFEVFLKNFGCFPNRKQPVIFIKLENTIELLRLQKEIEDKMKFKPFGKFSPHLTVAYRDLSVENFQKAWREYERKIFEDSFLAERIGLFKHENKKWNLLKTIHLNK